MTEQETRRITVKFRFGAAGSEGNVLNEALSDRSRIKLRSVNREAIFCEVPIENWLALDIPAKDEPWASYIEARNLFVADHFQKAVQVLQGILAMPNLESRHYLQTWHFLREAAVKPDAATAKQVYGVVVELPVSGGFDIVAAYADHTARYFNFSDEATILDVTDPALNDEIDAVLRAGKAVADQIGPWQAESLPPPPSDQARVSMLTPSGIHFEQAPLADLAAEEFCGPLVTAATRLMQSLIAKAEGGCRNPMKIGVLHPPR